MGAFIKFPEFQSSMSGGPAPLIIDVRRTPAFSAAGDMIAGALRRNPEQVAAWAAELPKTSKAVVYCVRGHEVSQSAAQALTERGIAAQYLEGGIGEGWKAAGGALYPRCKEGQEETHTWNPDAYR
jgi:rhodanese-related sulfurtransferase